jgi:Uma2 family endonuclease
MTVILNPLLTQAPPKPATFDEFMAWYPDNSEYRYELHRGVIIQMPKPL